MGYRELIESLRREGEVKVRLIWQEAEEEAEKIRRSAGEEIEQLQKEHQKRHSAEAGRLRERLILRAEEEARKVRLTAEQELSGRLYSIAISSLPDLRSGDYSESLPQLLKELPPLQWQRVKVNPEDKEVVGEHLPDAECIPENSIKGGVEAMTEDGRVHIINTLEKRLERAWEGMLPEIIKEVYDIIKKE